MARLGRMLRCSVFIATSLDGYIARDDGRLDWLDRVQLPGEDYGYAKFFATVDAVVMGRATYETALRFAEWPYAGKCVVVMTHRAPEPKQTSSSYPERPAMCARRSSARGAGTHTSTAAS